jgi:hypothetical protein
MRVDTNPATSDPIALEAAQWRAEIEAAVRGHAKFRALQNVALWEGVARAVRALAPASDITSYSIAGRSYTKADFDVLRSREQQLRADIESDIDGSGPGVGVLVGEVVR